MKLIYSNPIQFIILSLIILIILFIANIDNIKNSFLYFNRKRYKSQMPNLKLYQNVFQKKFNNKKITLNNVQIKTEDGETLDAFFLFNPEVEKVIIYSHGNGGLIDFMLNIFEDHGDDASILIYDYRGYGRSTGIPYEYGFYKDIMAVWRYLVFDINISPSRIIIYGHSIGVGPSTWLAKQLSEMDNKYYPKGMIMQAGFSGLKKIAIEGFGLVGFLVNDEFPNAQYVKGIDTFPIQLIHSRNDTIIPINHALDIQKNNKYIQLIIGDGHHNNPISKTLTKKIIGSFV